MKTKFFQLLFVLGLSINFIACTNGEEGINNQPDENKNPLAETLWSCEDEIEVMELKFTRYIEFIDETRVQMWLSDEGKIYQGTYTIKDKTVTFHNMQDRSFYYIDATFTSNTLTVSFSIDEAHETGPYYEIYTKVE